MSETVWAMTLMAQPEYGFGPKVRQVHAVVATKTKAAAIRAFDTNSYQFNGWACETGNADDIATASSEPGRLFVRPLDGRGEWIAVARPEDQPICGDPDHRHNGSCDLYAPEPSGPFLKVESNQ